MMMDVKLKIDQRDLSFTVPEDTIFYHPKEVQMVVDHVAFTEKLTTLINRNYPGNHSNRYRGSASAHDNKTAVAIVVADNTRLSEFRKYMPWIEEALMKSDLQHHTLRFFIAYGSHPKQTEEESLTIYGEYYSKYEFIHHDAKSGDFIDFGITSSGTRVKINAKLFSEHDLVITYGSISHHYFAGFGGGRKLIFPGLAKFSSILHNHSLFLDFEEKVIHTSCQSGAMEGNPLAEDLKEIYEMLPTTIGIHAILDHKGKVAEFEIGDNYPSFEKACNTYAAYYRMEATGTHDVVLASTGGFPKDINFIQTHKSIHTAARFVKDQGTLIMLASCSNGIGNDQLMEIFRRSTWDRIFPENREQYLNNTGTALAHLQKTNRIRICMVTSLSDEICSILGIQKIDHSTAREIIDRNTGSFGIIENTSLIF